MNKNISNNELLNELSERVTCGSIKCISSYCFSTDKIRFSFETDQIGMSFESKLNIEKQFRYHQNYQNLCLPLSNQLNEKKQNNQLETLKTKLK